MGIIVHDWSFRVTYNAVKSRFRIPHRAHPSVQEITLAKLASYCAIVICKFYCIRVPASHSSLRKEISYPQSYPGRNVKCVLLPSYQGFASVRGGTAPVAQRIKNSTRCSEIMHQTPLCAPKMSRNFSWSAGDPRTEVYRLLYTQRKGLLRSYSSPSTERSRRGPETHLSVGPRVFQ